MHSDGRSQAVANRPEAAFHGFAAFGKSTTSAGTRDWKGNQNINRPDMVIVFSRSYEETAKHPAACKRSSLQS